MIDWAYTFWTRKRESLNFVQPQIVPNFTRIGFTKRTLPDDVFNPIRAFWDKRKADNDFTHENYGMLVYYVPFPSGYIQHGKCVLMGL